MSVAFASSTRPKADSLAGCPQEFRYHNHLHHFVSNTLTFFNLYTTTKTPFIIPLAISQLQPQYPFSFLTQVWHLWFLSYAAVRFSSSHTNTQKQLFLLKSAILHFPRCISITVSPRGTPTGFTFNFP